MRYDNQYFLDNALTKQEAAETLFVGNDVWAVPDCGCPTTPDPEKLKHEDFADLDPDEIEHALGNKYQCFASV